EEMANGQIDALVVPNPYPMGYQGVRLLKALGETDQPVVAEMFPHHGEPEGDIYDTGLKVVVPIADSPLKKEHVSSTTEFLILEDFRVWLKENDLTGS
ncbi:MAG: hypothetical protein ACKVT0_22205, partial [Planctomycetaceae bacterium]